MDHAPVLMGYLSDAHPPSRQIAGPLAPHDTYAQRQVGTRLVAHGVFLFEQCRYVAGQRLQLSRGTTHYHAGDTRVAG